MDALAALGDNVVCKLSGLAMPLESMTVGCLRPVDRARPRGIRPRPVHVRQQLPGRRMHGTFDELYTTFAQRLDSTTAADDKLFATNAERIYRC